MRKYAVALVITAVVVIAGLVALGWLAYLRDQLEPAGLLGVDPPPSNELIGFLSGTGIYLMDPYGRDVRLVTSRDVWGSYELPKWSPDGTRIVYVGIQDVEADSLDQYSCLYIVNNDGTGGREFTDTCHLVNGLPSYPSWSPDGTRVLFGCASDICVINADGTGLRRIAPGDIEKSIKNLDPSWSSDGKYISFRKLATPCCQPHDEPMRGWSDSYIIMSFPEGEELLTLGPFDPHGYVGLPAPWSPSGMNDTSYAVAFMASLNGEDSEIFSDSLREGPRGLYRSGWSLWLTDNDFHDSDPVWSPQGRLAFVGDTEDGPEIFLSSNCCKPSPTRQLTNNLVVDGNPVWSPDGKKIAYTSERDGPSVIHVMDDEGKNILSTRQSGIPWGWISTN